MSDQVTENEALRLRRLVFYAADIERMNHALLGFVRKSGAQAAMLIDREGHLVARQGFAQQAGEGQTLAALVAGSFASTKQVAKVLGELDFRVMSHTGETHSIHMTLLGERTLQVAVFPSSVKAGMIAVFCKELATQIETFLVEAAKRTDDGAPKDQLESNFTDAMKNQLDSLFGNL
jgi:predicted regulator of Ras-like GTPase activity (Roadblock/LC7/MglB family)